VHGSLLRTVTYSRVSARHRLVAWVRFLALTASHPERPFEAVTIGRGADAPVTAVRLPRMDPDTATGHLRTFVGVFDQGMREPLPIACLTTAAYAEALSRGEQPAQAGAREWRTEWMFPREDQDLEHQLVFGGVLSFEELCARPGFDDYARRLWEAALAWERR
jgi:exodeoxyribonuclease V gamma subunit